MSATATPSARLPRLAPLARMGDEELAARAAAAGDDAAFSALYERYHGPLLGYCRSILLDDEDANDATQSALENALRSLPRREPGRPLRPWLYRIAHNESINIVRRRRPQTELSELDAPTVAGPEVDAEQRGRLAQLVDDLRGLPERQRGALVMRELSGLSYDEIAGALGGTPEAARRAVFDARSALHAAVDGRTSECRSVRHCISDGDRRSLRARRIRAHLRSCDDCASFQRAIRARSADLHLLGPWLSGAALAGVLGGGGGGALVAVGGGGAATVTVAAWSSMPVLVKSLAVVAVVATTGGAAAEIKQVSKRDDPAPRTQAAGPATAPGSPTRLPAARVRARAARPATTAGRSRRGAARAHAAPETARSSAGSGTLASSRSTAPATAPPAQAATAPAAAQQQQAPAPAASRPVTETAEQLAAGRLKDVREQVLAALAQAQAIASGGTPGAQRAAQSMLQSTLASLGATIDRVLTSVGLTLPDAIAAPAPTTTTASSPSLLAPVQQVLGGVDSLLSKLLARAAERSADAPTS